MRRKIIKQGLGGCTISLPIKWVRENNLSSGQEVELKEEDKNLVITCKDKFFHKKKEIYLTKKSSVPIIRSLIASAYKSGYDEIILHFQNKPPIKQINEIINSFTGLEIISHTDKSLKIKSFLQDQESEIENLILKMFQIVNTMIKTTLSEWRKTDLDSLRTFTEFNVRKIRDHCLRIIHKNKYKEDKAHDYYDLVTQLEKLAAYITYLAEHIIETKPKTKELISDFQKHYKGIYHCYLKKDFYEMNNIWENHRKKTRDLFQPKSLNNLVKKHGSIVVHYYALMMCSRQIASRMLSILN